MTKVIEFSPAGRALGLDKKFAEEQKAMEENLPLIEEVLTCTLSKILDRRRVERDIENIMELAGMIELDPPKPKLLSKREFLAGYTPKSHVESMLYAIVRGHSEAHEKLTLHQMGVLIYEIFGSEDKMREVWERVCEPQSNPGMAMTILEKAWDGIGMWVS